MHKTIEQLSRFGLTLQIIKTALAAAVSWFVATNLLRAEYPYFAAIAAILTVQVTVADSVDKATQRIIGIIGGVLLSMLIGLWLEVNVYSIFFVILAGMAVSKALRMNPQIISQVAISSLLVLAFGHINQGYAFERIIETVIGSAIAVIINAVIVPQNAIPDVENSIVSLAGSASQTLSSLRALLDYKAPKRKTGRTEVNALKREYRKTLDTLGLAEQSLRYNLFLTNKRTRLTRLAVSIRKLDHIIVQIRGIRRGLDDLQQNRPSQLSPEFAQQLAQAMEVTANCIPLFGKASVQPATDVLANLREANQHARTLQAHCLGELRSIPSPEVLRDVGSILTDLSRILAETEKQSSKGK
ncbi:FUSC family protein [Pontibacter sp. Tf4]|uniref:FUSC family protein n=1 Tax=Pontibacter sp. Tf4 TaxID=2761620 RepID=UPI00162532DB|nr:aromatic acid exporter family protein [Pontibacter sp. Tf4]MBB6610399.1 FUSC family protein [Pontibacter sp. Tf4]